MARNKASTLDVMLYGNYFELYAAISVNKLSVRTYFDESVLNFDYVAVFVKKSLYVLELAKPKSFMFI